MNDACKLKVCFMGGRQAGLIGVLTLLSSGAEILCAVSYSEDLTNVLNNLKIPIYNSVQDTNFIKMLHSSDLLLSVHGREIIESDILQLPKYGAINIHPYLYKYKGANPVERALKDKEYKASVGCHFMEEAVDQGKALIEEFIDVSGVESVEEIYNKLYPYYCILILKILDTIINEREKYKK